MVHAKFGRQRRICCSFICSNKGQELLMSDFYIFKVSHPWIARGAFGGDSFLFGMKKNMRFFPTIPLEPASQTAKTLMYRRVVYPKRGLQVSETRMKGAICNQSSLFVSSGRGLCQNSATFHVISTQRQTASRKL